MSAGRVSVRGENREREGQHYAWLLGCGAREGNRQSPLNSK